MDARDEALDRLTGADPADGIATREGVLRAKVDALTGDRADGGPAGGTTPGDPTGDGRAEDPADELAPRRRRRASLLVAAAVAGAVVVGGGGYAVGTATASQPEAASDAAAPIVLNGGRGGGDQAAEGSADMGVATESAGDMAATDDMAYPSWFDGRATFGQDGLSTDAGTATAYAYDATSAATKEGAAALAAELGVSGEPRWEYGSWAVGPQDGTGPTIWLSVDATAYFSYNDPAADPWRCEEVEALTEEEQAAVDSGAEPMPACAEPEGTVSEDDAVDALLATMERIGVDADRFEVDPSTSSEPGARWVTAHEVVDGQRTGATWSATVSEDGVAWLDGFLATTVELGDYPVVSPAEAVERLSDPAFGQNAWPVTYGPAAEARLAGEEQLDEPYAPAAPPSSGSDLPWKVTDVTITGARLGLAQEYRQGESALLLPAYELSDDEGNVWTVVAVADDALDRAAG